jgi:hypothetical protein
MKKNQKVTCKICGIKRTSRGIGRHVSDCHSISPETYYLNHLRKSICYCPVCGSVPKFQSIPKGYKTYCSPACLRAALKSDPGLREKNRSATIYAVKEKYGVDSVIGLDWCRDKRSKTMISKYGTDVPINVPSIRDKIEATNLTRYGCKNPFSNEDIIKTKILPKKDYSDIVRKSKNTCLTKYGHSSYKSYIAKLEMVGKIFDGSRLSGSCTPLFSREDYTKVSANYEWECNACNTVFHDDINHGSFPRCPSCSPLKHNTSIAEEELYTFLLEHLDATQIICNDRSILDGKELDIYIPEYNIAIEHDGLYFHSEGCGQKHKSYHVNKTDLCAAKGIQLIHIFEDEWAYKRDIVKNRIAYHLNKISHRLHARKCNIQLVDSSDANIFLENNHLQGGLNSTIKIGLYHNDVLVSIMTFGKLRDSLGHKRRSETSYELYRFCTQIGTAIPGAFSKLLKFFIRKYNPTQILTYADLRYSVGGLYEKAGFVNRGKTNINYWYFKNGYLIRHHRYAFAKHKLSTKLDTFDHKLTEWQNMQLNGYDRIWDCGNLKYTMEFS